MTGIDGGILLRDIRGEQHTTIDKNCEEDGGLTDAITRTVRRVLPFCQKKPSELEEGGKKKGETRRGKNAGQADQQIAAGASSRTCRVGRGAVSRVWAARLAVTYRKVRPMAREDVYLSRGSVHERAENNGRGPRALGACLDVTAP